VNEKENRAMPLQQANGENRHTIGIFIYREAFRGAIAVKREATIES